MIVQTDSQKEVVLKKLDSFFDFSVYADFCLLDAEEFIVKYGHLGFSFSEFVCVRFSITPCIFKEVSDFLPDEDYFIIPIALEVINVFEINRGEIEDFVLKNNITDFVILESKLNWLLVYDKYRKLFGLGEYIRDKMLLHIVSQSGLYFGKTKLMFCNSSVDYAK